MFGSVPGVFKNKQAACDAAKAYEKEQGDQWIIVCKIIGEDGLITETIDKKSVQNIHYQPCPIEDFKRAKKEKWTEC